ncbi:hypothetical protein [Mesorhizobium sp. WSM4887]|uniref:hypothetical protein n=1 Tax=Mesorhizobium sp. WSM4887 TaxID=3038543 RepID=UPI002415C8DE|nr:hypothetical protein [Mesorhizobium sp. WSM4887]MDG4886804.1 hypothetical protein [Mesorhizobium sp. WSM4887]
MTENSLFFGAKQGNQTETGSHETASTTITFDFVAEIERSQKLPGPLTGWAKGDPRVCSRQVGGAAPSSD